MRGLGWFSCHHHCHLPSGLSLLEQEAWLGRGGGGGGFESVQYTVFTRLEAGRLFIKINLQTRLLIVTRLVNEA